MRLDILRVHQEQTGTLGILLFNGIPRLTTFELPWLANQHDISCIPDGKYQISRIISPKHGEVFEVEDVPGRTEIQFHIGNSLKDTEGCIMVGMGFNQGTFPAITESKTGFSWFMNHLETLDSAELTITWA